MYHRLDSHWNNKGAALARDTILETLEIEHNIKWYDVAYDIVKNHRGIYMRCSILWEKNWTIILCFKGV